MIINLTQHTATPDQTGVVDLRGDELFALRDALTFDALPTAEEIHRRAEYIADLAVHNGLGEEDDPFPDAAMIGGAPYLMAPLTDALRARGITPLFAFTAREVEEQPQPDGSVRKVAVFRHRGWIEAL